jgi:hypothetical protein
VVAHVVHDGSCGRGDAALRYAAEASSRVASDATPGAVMTLASCEHALRQRTSPMPTACLPHWKYLRGSTRGPKAQIPQPINCKGRPPSRSTAVYATNHGLWTVVLARGAAASQAVATLEILHLDGVVVIGRGTKQPHKLIQETQVHVARHGSRRLRDAGGLGSPARRGCLTRSKRRVLSSQHLTQAVPTSDAQEGHELCFREARRYL